MRTSSAISASERPGRNAVNDLYDHGAELVETAAALRERAAARAAVRAAPAVMGCIEVALRDLTAATNALERVLSAAVGDGADARARRRHDLMRRSLASLQAALEDSADAAAAARALTARALVR